MPPAMQALDMALASLHHGAQLSSGDRFLDARSGEHLVRLIESALDVQQRFQFFTWASTQMHALTPHRALACGSYSRQRLTLQFDPFYSVPLAAPTIESLSQAGGELLRMAAAAWVEGQGKPLALELSRFPGAAAQREASQLAHDTGCALLLVHGVSRPLRLAEIDSLFVLVCPNAASAARQLRHLELIVPTLQATWWRVLMHERALRAAPSGDAAKRVAPTVPKPITQRECEILAWVREGMSNQRIADRLNISPLTVKNHVQKILRKLGAANRAQAVALAMSQSLLDGPPADDPAP